MCKIFINFEKILKSIWWVHFCWMSPFPNRNFGDAIAVQNLREIYILYISVQNFVRCFTPRTKILAPLLCVIAFVWQRTGVHCTFSFVTMNFSISTDFSVTLFGFLSSLALNNRIENLTLMIKISGGGPYFRGALRQCLFCHRRSAHSWLGLGGLAP